MKYRVYIFLIFHIHGMIFSNSKTAKRMNYFHSTWCYAFIKNCVSASTTVWKHIAGEKSVLSILCKEKENLNSIQINTIPSQLKYCSDFIMN